MRRRGRPGRIVPSAGRWRHRAPLPDASPRRPQPVTDGPRRAYALGFGVRSREYLLRTEFPWNAARESARQKRADAAQGHLHRYAALLRKTVKRVLFR